MKEVAVAGSGDAGPHSLKRVVDAAHGDGGPHYVEKAAMGATDGQVTHSMGRSSECH